VVSTVTPLKNSKHKAINKDENTHHGAAETAENSRMIDHFYNSWKWADWVP